MTRHLILMRHAKSDWGDRSLPDRDRPLNARGRAAAPRMGAWLAAAGILPDTVLVSPARRTRETWRAVAEALDQAPVPIFEPRLYEADEATIIEVLRHAQGQSVLVLGHNPGLAHAAQALTAAPPDHPRFADYPTGATLILRLPVADWAELDRGTGRAIAFAVPRDLD
ncbi:MAG: SixA phosphatase family protein [Tranquillimonas sp.]